MNGPPAPQAALLFAHNHKPMIQHQEQFGAQYPSQGYFDMSHSQ